MITKRRFSPLKVQPYVQGELLLALVAAVLAFSLHRWEPLVALPFSIAATLGGALAIFIGFRNNSAYGRWWEARTLWGGIVNSSRVLARLIITFTDSHAHQPNYDRARSEAFKRAMVLKVVAWAHALRLQLRGESDLSPVTALLPSDERTTIVKAGNKPNLIMQAMGRRIYQAMADGTLGGFDSFQIEGQLLALANHQGGCERIKNTPIPFSYSTFIKKFIVVYTVTLPFGFALVMGWMAVPVVMFIFYVLASLELIAEEIEDPFGRDSNDLPMERLAATIADNVNALLDRR